MAPAAASPPSRKHPTYRYVVLPGNGSQLVDGALASRPWWQPASTPAPFHLWWGGNGQPFDFAAGLSTEGGRAAKQLVNKFATHKELCTKTRLAINLQRYCKAARVEPGTIAPLTVTVNVGSKQDMLTFRRIAAAESAKGGSKMWICKPGNLNRGRGIHVCASAREAEAHIRKQKPDTAWVLQEYIERPLLLGNRKFDIRQFVLVTSDLAVYMYRDSYIRTSSTAYDQHNTDDLSIHLTNDAVQKMSASYGQHEDANKLSFAEFQRALDENPLSDGRVLSFENEVWPAMQSCIAHTFSAILPHFKTSRSYGRSFELYGCDFMVSAEGRTALIEVNTSPALLSRGDFLTAMLPRLVEECVQKAVDTVFVPPPGVARPEPLDRFELVEVPRTPVAGVTTFADATAAASSSAASGTVVKLPPIPGRGRGLNVVAG